MGTSSDMHPAALLNLVFAAFFFLLFALVRIREKNEQLYFPKWHVKVLEGLKTPLKRKNFIPKLKSFRAFLASFGWIRAVLKVAEHDLIDHAGLDSVVYLRIYLTGVKILVPICVIVFILVVPINYTNRSRDVDGDDYIGGIDKLSILNVPLKSERFWTHIIVAYGITLWTCCVLKAEYQKIASMRMHFISEQRHRPSRYTVLVRNVPTDPDRPTRTVSQIVEDFFMSNYSDHYLTHQVVYEASKISNLMKKRKINQNKLDRSLQRLAKRLQRNKNGKRPKIMRGCKIGDAIDFYTSEIERLNEEIVAERKKRMENPVEFMKNTAFVFFKTGWGAAVCAQTQQTRNTKLWLIEWAPEPDDVCWNSLAYKSIPTKKIMCCNINPISLPTRRIFIGIFFVILAYISTFFYSYIAYAFSIKHGPIATTLGFKSIAKIPVIGSYIQAILPQLPLRLYLIYVVDAVVKALTRLLRLSSESSTERRNISWKYIVLLINSFLLIIIPTNADEDITEFFFPSPMNLWQTVMPGIFKNMPKKDSYFIVYIMLGGAGVAKQILRFNLVIGHYLNLFAALTRAHYSRLSFNQEPDIQLYLLLALVYAVISPLLLLCVIIFLALSYLVYRNQFINVYHQEYESAAEYWPDVHGRIIVALIASQILLMGFLTVEEVYHSIPLLLPLPVSTLVFYRYCKAHFEPAFVRFPMQEAIHNDMKDQNEPMIDLKDHLLNAYTNPVFKDEVEADLENSLDTHPVYNDDVEADLENNPEPDQTSRAIQRYGSRRRTPS